MKPKYFNQPAIWLLITIAIGFTIALLFTSCTVYNIEVKRCECDKQEFIIPEYPQEWNGPYYFDPEIKTLPWIDSIYNNPNFYYFDSINFNVDSLIINWNSITDTIFNDTIFYK